MTRVNEKYHEIEHLIIGSIVLHGSSVYQEASRYIKTHEVFYDDRYKLIWQGMTELYEQGTPIEIALLTRHMNRSYPITTLNTDSWGYTITRTLEFIGGPLRIFHWCAAMLDDYAERLTQTALHELPQTKDAWQIMQQVDKKLKEVLSIRAEVDWMDASQIALQLIERRQKFESGEIRSIKTGYRELDHITGGLETGMIVIAARPSMGKTAFAASLLCQIAMQGIPVGIISLEMPNIQVGARIASILTGKSFASIFKEPKPGTDPHELIQIANKLSEYPIYSTDKSGMNLGEIRYRVEKLVKVHKAKLVIIDYIQLVNTKGETKNETREREVARLSAGIKILSKEMDIPIIVLAQLNRESESSEKVSKPGKLSQLRESDAILADADMGVIVDRPYKRGQVENEQKESTINEVDLIIEKNRNGSTGIVHLHFDPDLMRVRDKDENIYYIKYLINKAKESGASVPPSAGSGFTFTSQPNEGFKANYSAPPTLALPKDDC